MSILRIDSCDWTSIARNYLRWKVPANFISPLNKQILTVENEKEKYDCTIGTSILLILVFAYDGIIMGLPRLNFWMYLVLPHTLLALLVAGYIWKRGILHSFPTAYILGFTAFLILVFLHQQNFLQNQRDWRGNILIGDSDNSGMTALLSHALNSKDGVITIDSAPQTTPNETLTAVGEAIRNYWQTLVNYTQQMQRPNIRV